MSRRRCERSVILSDAFLAEPRIWRARNRPAFLRTNCSAFRARPLKSAHSDGGTSSLFGLAPCGACPARGITVAAVRSYRTFSPLLRRRCERFVIPSDALFERRIWASREASRGLPCKTHVSLASSEAFTTAAGRYVFCGTFRPPGLNPASRTLSGTLLCGVRTFLPAHSRKSRSSLCSCQNGRGGRPVRLPTSVL